MTIRLCSIHATGSYSAGGGKQGPPHLRQILAAGVAACGADKGCGALGAGSALLLGVFTCKCDDRPAHLEAPFAVCKLTPHKLDFSKIKG